MSPEEPKAYLKLGLVVLFLILIVILSSIFIHPLSSKPLISPGFLQGINLSSTFTFVFKSGSLSRIIQKNLSGKDGEYAIYIEDLSTDKAGLADTENYIMNSLDTFPAASLYKVYLLAAVIKETDLAGQQPRDLRGRLTMETKISARKSFLVERFGSEDFGYEDIGDDEVIEYSVEEALTRVGRISDNFAAIMLADKVGWEKIQEMAEALGAKNTVIKTPISTSAEDIGLFFKKLYLREVVSPQVSEGVIKYLSLNQLNDRIPAKITNPNISNPSNPSNPSIIHKTGELSRVRHDAGIVWLGSTSEVTGTGSSEVGERAYIIVLMSKDLKYEDEGVETLANISKEVYEYFRDKSLK